MMRKDSTSFTMCYNRGTHEQLVHFKFKKVKLSNHHRRVPCVGKDAEYVIWVSVYFAELEVRYNAFLLY